jgi:hypothetical protein
MEITNEVQPIHSVLGLDEPDPRLKDIEIIFRFIAISLFGQKYSGNLKKFLDFSMAEITSKWNEYQRQVVNVYEQFNESLETLKRILDPNRIGRKFTSNKWDHIFNKARGRVFT